ncbi:MerR family transcriptional regulator [Pseudoalteromonas sp.]|uniref:MerR family transcriptional regulator n=1 Tax=Pseudoalteromonas sp. TaxID=53249 RepID=UPI003562366F
MYVKQLATKMGVTPDTVRHYTRLQLLRPIRNLSNGYQQYSQRDQQRLSFIINARQLGFSLQDIQQIIAESEQGHCPCPLTRQLITKRLAETEALFQQTLKLRTRMQAAVKQWQGLANGASAAEVCSLIESFVDPISSTDNKPEA